MKLKLIVLMMTVSLATASAFAAGQEVTIGVKGMVCAFCAQGIEKKFHALPAVDQVKVSLGEKQVKLTLKAGQEISDDAIRSVLTQSGYNVDQIDRQ